MQGQQPEGAGMTDKALELAKERLKPLPRPKLTPVPKVGAALVILCDVSGSMGEPVDNSGGRSKLSVAWEAFRTELKGRMMGWSLGILLFGTMEGDGVQWLLVPTSQAEVDKLQEPKPQGDTPLLPALRTAWLWLAARAEKGRIIVFTDGEANKGGGPADILKEAQEHRTVPIDTVALGGSADLAFLRHLSELTGGVHRSVSQARELFEAVLALSPAERPLLGKPS